MTAGDVAPGPAEKPVPVIMLVEDDVFVRFTTAEMLREQGFGVVEAVDAGEALALLAAGRPVDLVLSDIRMPGDMDGIGLTFAVKKLRPDLPIVLVSSHLPPDTIHCGDDFLAKPYGADELFATVERAMGDEWKSERNRKTS